MASTDRNKPARPDRKSERSERLAAALRANLRRRKAQARERQAVEKPFTRDQKGP